VTRTAVTRTAVTRTAVTRTGVFARRFRGSCYGLGVQWRQDLTGQSSIGVNWCKDVTGQSSWPLGATGTTMLRCCDAVFGSGRVVNDETLNHDTPARIDPVRWMPALRIFIFAQHLYSATAATFLGRGLEHANRLGRRQDAGRAPAEQHRHTDRIGWFQCTGRPHAVAFRSWSRRGTAGAEQAQKEQAQDSTSRKGSTVQRTPGGDTRTRLPTKSSCPAASGTTDPSRAYRPGGNFSPGGRLRLMTGTGGFPSAF
jgi:hypothetical protein